jgi:hypothetical protein
LKVETDLPPKALKHFIQISRLWETTQKLIICFENEEESRFNFLQIKGKTPVQTNKTSHRCFCFLSSPLYVNGPKDKYKSSSKSFSFWLEGFFLVSLFLLLKKKKKVNK